MGRHAPTPEQHRAMKHANGHDDLTWWDWLRGVGRSVVEGAKVVKRAVVG